MKFFGSIFGALASASAISIVLGSSALLLTLGFTGAPLLLWTLAAAALLYGFGVPLWVWILFAIPAVVFNLRALRRTLVTRPIMKMMRAFRFLPVISDTERTAIEAGTVWVDGELFSGKPDFARLS